jgi:succinyl-CoA synthetase alpha subunit
MPAEIVERLAAAALGQLELLAVGGEDVRGVAVQREVP